MKTGSCLFCDAPDLVETSVWPAWLDRIVPREKYRRISSPSDPVSSPDRPHKDLRAHRLRQPPLRLCRLQRRLDRVSRR